MDLGYWKAIQWDNSLDAINVKRYYSKDNNEDIPKGSNDIILNDKTVVEIESQKEGTARVIELS